SGEGSGSCTPCCRGRPTHPQATVHGRPIPRTEANNARGRSTNAIWDTTNYSTKGNRLAPGGYASR
ncbi:MAG: hypothetical protein Q8K68_13230, partial [Nitrospirota bacterium]|nr:hypothetical protein [Nitrospirota bacterium]